MTETKTLPLFDAFRTDPRKVAEGVWIEHPDTKDRFLVRRRWCPEHCRAYLQAQQDYEREHGKDSGSTPDAQSRIDAVAMATGVILGWELPRNPGLAYDPASMAAALNDPQLADLRMWITVHTELRGNFRPDAALGN